MHKKQRRKRKWTQSKHVVSARKVYLKKRVRERRKAGDLLETIAAEFGLSKSTVCRWCQDIKVTPSTELEVIGLLKGEQIWRTSEIVKHSKFTRQAVMLALNSLLEKGVITKIKRGHYQKSGV
ncbi:hypothetical protein C6503_19370 [Candidatus Poribacteria bacterium]|nr:MAG: hypothetical protein C6503_19370 [Candidatus Poribacteria bacterium]